MNECILGRPFALMQQKAAAKRCEVYLGSQWRVTLKVREYKLLLKSAFGTSHSSTTERRNALICIRVDTESESSARNVLKGYGEIGLPPKKISAGYLADYDDVDSYCGAFFAWVQGLSREWPTKSEYNPFAAFHGSPFFSGVLISKDGIGGVCRFLLESLDSCPANKEAYSTFPRNGIEGAILDIWSQFTKQPLYNFIHPNLSLSPALESPDKIVLGRSFYTVSLNADIEAMVEQAKHAIQYTPYLKIKLDGDIERGEAILNRLIAFLNHELPTQKWEISVDANAAWTPDISLHFLNFFSAHKGRVFMLEQPFETHISDASEIEAWKKAAAAYRSEGIYIFADESVATAADVREMKDYVHGVNIKLEKAGGIRGAISAIQTASQLNLLVWIGMMVGSQLSCSMGCHLLPHAAAGDLDAALFMQDSSQGFANGFAWGRDQDIGKLTFTSTQHGIGTTKIQRNPRTYTD